MNFHGKCSVSDFDGGPPKRRRSTIEVFPPRPWIGARNLNPSSVAQSNFHQGKRTLFQWGENGRSPCPHRSWKKCYNNNYFIIFYYSVAHELFKFWWALMMICCLPLKNGVKNILQLRTTTIQTSWNIGLVPFKD